MLAVVERSQRAQQLVRAQHARPPCQQNDYLGWILRPKLPETCAKRLHPMIERVRAGDAYMEMPTRAGLKPR